MYMLHNYFTVFIYRNHTFTSYKFVFLLWCLSCSSVKLGYGLSLDRGSSLLHRTRRGKNMNHGGSVSRKSAAWLLLRAAWCSLQTPGKTIFLMFQSQIGGWSVIMPDHDTAAAALINHHSIISINCGLRLCSTQRSRFWSINYCLRSRPIYPNVVCQLVTFISANSKRNNSN